MMVLVIIKVTGHVFVKSDLVCVCDRIPHEEDSRFHSSSVEDLSHKEQAHNIDFFT